MKKYFLSFLLVIALALSACGSNKTEEYRNNSQNAVDDLIDSSMKAEKLVDNYANVWNFSIKSKGAIPIQQMASTAGITEEEVKEYFQINAANNVDKDFSSNIYSLKSYYESTGEIEELENTLIEIKELVANLKNPPSEYEEAYNEILDLYNLSDEYIRMAINPGGSLQEFNADNKRLTSEIINKQKRIDVVMPE